MLAVHRQRENAGISAKDAGRAIALVHVQVNHRHAQGRLLAAVTTGPFRLHQAGRHRRVIENAKAAAFVCAGVVRAAGHVGGHTGRRGIRATLQT